MENKRLRETVPENEVASLQEHLAAAKLREAEANLALKELRSKVAELSGMWQKHLKRKSLEQKRVLEAGEGAGDDGSSSVVAAPSTPKKLLGSLLEAGGLTKSEVTRLEEEMMTIRMSEVGAQAELKDQNLKVMELETENQVIANQLKRQSDDLLRLRGSLDTKTESENRLEKQVRESKRQYADLESKMKEEIMMARIRDAENTQRVAELTQKISGLECKNQGRRE